MILALIAAVTIEPATLGVLFLGNSHTASNDVPGMVRELIQSDGSGTVAKTKLITAGFVEELAKSEVLAQEVRSGKFNALVMQGAKLSSSHRYDYDHSGAVDIAKLAKRSGLSVWLFAEWPRRGWKETDYILKEYREIADPSGARIIPTCRAWDRLITEGFKPVLWQSDGNHATQVGSFVAASTIAAFLSPKSPQVPSWRPAGLSPRDAGHVHRVAREIAASAR